MCEKLPCEFSVIEKPKRLLKRLLVQFPYIFYVLIFNFFLLNPDPHIE